MITSWLSLLVITIGYGGVIFEHQLGLKKSVVMMAACTLAWLILAASQTIEPAVLQTGFQEEFLSFSEIFFVIVVAMTYIFSLEHHGFFNYLEIKILKYTQTVQGLFWISGLGAFVLSPFLDNLTTSLVMGQIVMRFCSKDAQIIPLLLLNIVIAANAGGVFSPFGDLTSLMLWQKGFVGAPDFLYLVIPSLIAYLIPAMGIAFFIPSQSIESNAQPSDLDTSAWMIIFLSFLLTLLVALIGQHLYHLPAVFGLLGGLGLLGLIEHYVYQRNNTDFFGQFAKIEWDTLLFFYAIMLAIEVLSLDGWLDALARSLYEHLPLYWALDGKMSSVLGHSLIGLISAVIDNIPMMATVLKMPYDFSTGSWLLLALTTGLGGSLLSIGSASGIALMGLSKESYNFSTHLKFAPLIFVGYLISIATHLFLNQGLFL